MITNKMANKFSENQDINTVMEFLEKLTSGHLDSYDFEAHPFTLLDHRRISELLSNLYSEKYKIGEVSSPNKDIHTFLVRLYEL